MSWHKEERVWNTWAGTRDSLTFTQIRTNVDQPISAVSITARTNIAGCSSPARSQPVLSFQQSPMASRLVQCVCLDLSVFPNLLDTVLAVTECALDDN